MITVQLHLPDDLANKTLSISDNIETFILDLLSTKINEVNNNTLLADEYYLASIENKALINDFSNIDNEGWDDDY